MPGFIAALVENLSLQMKSVNNALELMLCVPCCLSTLQFSLTDSESGHFCAAPQLRTVIGGSGAAQRVCIYYGGGGGTQPLMVFFSGKLALATLTAAYGHVRPAV